MNRKKISIAAAILVSLITAVVLVSFRDVTKEPSYQGKPLSKWLENFFKLEPPHDPPMPEAQIAIRSIGTNALPHLLRMFSGKDSGLKRWLCELDRRKSLLNLRFLRMHSAEAEHERAAAGFVTLADIAEPVAPEVARLAQDRTEVSELAGIVLPYLGNNGMISAISMLSSTNPVERASMAFNLSGPVTTSQNENSCVVFSEGYRRRASVIVIPALIKLLDDPDYRVVPCAAFTLGRLRTEPRIVVPALTNLIQDARVSQGSRIAAAQALGNFGAEARVAVPLLKRLADEDQGKMGTSAARVLKQIVGDSASKSKLESN